MNIDDVLAELDERLGVENDTEEKYCDCVELVIHGQQRDGFPGLVIFRHRCPNLIRELPALVYSKSNREDADDSCSDHAVASLRYGLTRRVMWSGKVRVYGL